MAKLDADATSTTNMANTVQNFKVDTGQIDQTNTEGETYWDYPETNNRLGYYQLLPTLKNSIDILAMYALGRGYTSLSTRTQKVLENITGWGEDTFNSIMWSMLVQKKVFGDSFAEIIRDDKGNLINLKPLYTGDMRVIVNSKGLIKSYEQRIGTDAPIKFERKDILHLVNDRIANQIHGTSVVDAVVWTLDAKQEALDTMRKIMRRQLAMGTLIIDTEDETEQNKIKAEYQTAIDNGEVLVLPKDIAEIETAPANQMIGALQAWIEYLDDLAYRNLRVPAVLAGGSGGSEGSDKTGFLTFDQAYSMEAAELEADLWNQLAIKITFNKPVSIAPNAQENEAKNTSQTSFLPSETTAGVSRE